MIPADLEPTGRGFLTGHGGIPLAWARWEHPAPLQAGVWGAACAGRDALAMAAPGAGKTLAFAVPAAAAAAEAGEAGKSKKNKKGAAAAAPPGGGAGPCVPVAVILVPARELATQVAAVCTGLRRGGGAGAAVKTGLVVGGVDRAAQAAALRGAAILVATPGRLLDLVDAGDVDLGTFLGTGVAWACALPSGCACRLFFFFFLFGVDDEVGAFLYF